MIYQDLLLLNEKPIIKGATEAVFSLKPVR